MKHFIILTVMLLFAAAAPAQQVLITGPAANKPDTKTQLPGFTREKFDPKRDPAVDLAAAMTTAKQSGKRIILDVGGEWCGWCVYMDKFFFLNPDIMKLRDDNFVWIKVNMSQENENKTFLAPYPVPMGYPHLYVLDETGKLLQSQDTSPLESGKGYDIGRFTQFLTDWAPKKASSGTTAVPPQQ